MQTLLSLQSSGGPPTHAPPAQRVAVVHALPSLQVPVLFASRSPVAGLHESSVHALPSLQPTPCPPCTSRRQVSPVVHAFPSSQGAVLFVNTQPVAGLHVSSCRRCRRCRPAAVRPRTIRAEQVSPVVHALPSLHARVVRVDAARRRVARVVGAHVAVVAVRRRRRHARPRPSRRRSSCRRCRRCTAPCCSRARSPSPGRRSRRCRRCCRCRSRPGRQQRRPSRCRGRARVPVVARRGVVRVDAARGRVAASRPCRRCCRCSSAPGRRTQRPPRAGVARRARVAVVARRGVVRVARSPSPGCSESLVQTLLSLQFGAGPPTHAPPRAGVAGRARVPVVARRRVVRVDAARRRVARVVGAPVVVVAVRRRAADADPAGAGVARRARVAVVARIAVLFAYDAARGRVAGVVGADVAVVAVTSRAADARAAASRRRRSCTRSRRCRRRVVRVHAARRRVARVVVQHVAVVAARRRAARRTRRPSRRRPSCTRCRRCTAPCCSRARNRSPGCTNRRCRRCRRCSSAPGRRRTPRRSRCRRRARVPVVARRRVVRVDAARRRVARVVVQHVAVVAARRRAAHARAAGRRRRSCTRCRRLHGTVLFACTQPVAGLHESWCTRCRRRSSEPGRPRTTPPEQASPVVHAFPSCTPPRSSTLRQPASRVARIVGAGVPVVAALVVLREHAARPTGCTRRTCRNPRRRCTRREARRHRCRPRSGRRRAQALPSLHGDSLFAYTQPVAGLHESSVHALRRRSSARRPPTHAPPQQVSATCTRCRRRTAPRCSRARSPCRVARIVGADVAVVAAGARRRPRTRPPEQLSPVVHALPSSHGAALFAFTQPVAGLHESSVHAFPSSQFGGAPPTQRPGRAGVPGRARAAVVARGGVVGVHAAGRRVARVVGARVPVVAVRAGSAHARSARANVRGGARAPSLQGFVLFAKTQPVAGWHESWCTGSRRRSSTSGRRRSRRPRIGRRWCRRCRRCTEPCCRCGRSRSPDRTSHRCRGWRRRNSMAIPRRRLPPEQDRPRCRRSRRRTESRLSRSRTRRAGCRNHRCRCSRHRNREAVPPAEAALANVPHGARAAVAAGGHVLPVHAAQSRRALLVRARVAVVAAQGWSCATHAPFEQMSPVVQTLPSLHGPVRMAWRHP